MNKWMVICMCALLLCGCGTKASSQDQNAQPSQSTPSQTQDQEQQIQPSQAQEEQVQSDTTGSQKISEQEALETALSHAGVKENDLTSKRIKMEWEDGAEVYNIEFHANGMEYDYEIRASDGNILESDHEIEDD